MVKGLEEPYKKRLRSLGLFRLDKSSLKSDLIKVCSFPTRSSSISALCH